MQTIKLKEDFYWTGIIDENLRVFDIIMLTEFGTTYNSYVLKTGDKTVLFETAKAKFFDEYLRELKKITERLITLWWITRSRIMQAVWSFCWTSIPT